MEQSIQDFLEFLDNSPTSFQATEQSVSRLARAGFCELKEAEEFKIAAGGKYYVTRNSSAVIAFTIGKDPLYETGFYLAASHLDSPLIKIKPETIKIENGICRVGVDVYGGPIVHTWTDRELCLAGRVTIKNGSTDDIKLKSVLININRPIAIIPNAAIHLNRDINKGFEYNRQTHLQAILSTDETSSNPLNNLIANELQIELENICEMDLFLYDANKAAIIGTGNDLIVSGRLDNLAMTHAIVSAIAGADIGSTTSVAVLYDNEEIGSESLQGAAGSFLKDVLKRISCAMKLTHEQHLIALNRSFMISADMAHAFHPSYAEKYDPSYAPSMNKGSVIKINANHRYATTSDSAAEFIRLCEQCRVPYQKFMTRSDLPCGTTIGPVASSQLGIRTVDIGNPMWAMHSIRETCGVRDHLDLIKVLGYYYSK